VGHSGPAAGVRSAWARSLPGRAAVARPEDSARLARTRPPGLRSALTAPTHENY